MNDLKEADRKATELELKARRELLLRLKHPTALLMAAGAKEQAKRKERVEAVRQYQTVEEVQDAYGYGDIDDYTRGALIEAIEAGDSYIDSRASAAEVALQILLDFTGRLSREAESLQFELLPLEQQTEILKDKEAHRQAMEARKAARLSGHSINMVIADERGPWPPSREEDPDGHSRE